MLGNWKANQYMTMWPMLMCVLLLIYQPGWCWRTRDLGGNDFTTLPEKMFQGMFSLTAL